MTSNYPSRLVEHFFSGTGDSYDRAVRRFTLGLDIRWKRQILQKLPCPGRALDLACGTGILTFAIARRFPDCHVVGVELREEYLEIATAKARAQGIRNVEFILCRAEDLALDDSFDCVTSSYLAKYADSKQLMTRLDTLLNPHGLVLFHDFTYPPRPLWAAGWECYFRMLQRFGKRIFPEWQNALEGLPDLIRKTSWLPEFSSALRENGYVSLQREYLTLGISAILTARKSGEPPQQQADA